MFQSIRKRWRWIVGAAVIWAVLVGTMLYALVRIDNAGLHVQREINARLDEHSMQQSASIDSLGDRITAINEALLDIQEERMDRAGNRLSGIRRTAPGCQMTAYGDLLDFTVDNACLLGQLIDALEYLVAP